MSRIAALLGQNSIEVERSERALNVHGISMIAREGIIPASLEIMIDPGVADTAFPIIERAICEIRDEGITGTEMRLEFVGAVECIQAPHKLTGRLQGTNVKLAPAGRLVRGDIEFYLGHLSKFRGLNRFQQGATYISLKLLCDCVPSEQIRDLLALLFDREVLFYQPEMVSYFDHD